jgi:hypothetical protein
LVGGASIAMPCANASVSQANAASWKRGSLMRCASHARTAASADQTIVSVAPEASEAAPIAASVRPIAQSSDAVSRSRR